MYKYENKKLGWENRSNWSNYLTQAYLAMFSAYVIANDVLQIFQSINIIVSQPFLAMTLLIAQSNDVLNPDYRTFKLYNKSLNLQIRNSMTIESTN